jgi:hypothetical protein
MMADIKKELLWCCLLFVMCCLPGRQALAAEFGVDLPVNSKYMWRGLELDKDPVFQPDVWVSYKGLSLTVWGNFELTNAHDMQHNFTEVDYTLKYAAAFDKLNYSAGYIYYDFPHTSCRKTQEFFASFGYDTFLSPAITVYRDIDEVDGWYTTLGLSHSIELKRLLNSTLTISETIGFSSANHSKFYYGNDTSAFSDSLLSAGLKIPVTESIVIVPTVCYTALLDKSIRGADLNQRSNILWCGVNITFSFDTGKKQ